MFRLLFTATILFFFADGFASALCRARIIDGLSARLLDAESRAYDAGLKPSYTYPVSRLEENGNVTLREKTGQTVYILDGRLVSYEAMNEPGRCILYRENRQTPKLWAGSTDNPVEFFGRIKSVGSDSVRFEITYGNIAPYAWDTVPNPDKPDSYLLRRRAIDTTFHSGPDLICRFKGDTVSKEDALTPERQVRVRLPNPQVISVSTSPRITDFHLIPDETRTPTAFEAEIKSVRVDEENDIVYTTVLNRITNDSIIHEAHTGGMGELRSIFGGMTCQPAAVYNGIYDHRIQEGLRGTFFIVQNSSLYKMFIAATQEGEICEGIIEAFDEVSITVKHETTNELVTIPIDTDARYYLNGNTAVRDGALTEQAFVRIVSKTPMIIDLQSGSISTGIRPISSDLRIHTHRTPQMHDASYYLLNGAAFSNVPETPAAGYYIHSDHKAALTTRGILKIRENALRDGEVR